MVRVLALLVVMGGTCWSRPEPDAKDRRREALERAAAWLLSGAKGPALWEYGPSRYFPMLCSRARGSPCVLNESRWGRAIDALCLSALLDAGPWLDDATRARVDELSRLRTPPSASPWDLAMELDLVLALVANRRVSRERGREAFRDAHSALATQQSREGSFGYAGAEGGDSTPLMTGLLVLTLERGARVGLCERTVLLDRARAFLARAYHADRDGFPYLADPGARTARGEAEMAGRSVLCARALEAGGEERAWKDLLGRRVRRYVECIPAFERTAWGRELHDPDSGIASYYVYFGAYHASEASLRVEGAGLDAIVAWIGKL